MTLPRKATICWLIWLVWAGISSAQPEPPDTLAGREPAPPPVEVDTLAVGAALRVPEDCAPVPGVPVLGTGQEVSRRLRLELASASLGEALFVTPAVYPVRAGWHGTPQFLLVRGAGPGETLYLVDGMPLSDSQLEVLDLNWLPLAGVEVFEIAPGGLSSVHGSGALAGVLGLQTVTAMPEFPESEIGAWWGSFDGRAVSLQFGRRITERLGVLSAYENLGTGGWTDHSAAHNDKLLGKVTALLGSTTQIDLTGYGYRGDFQWPDSCLGSFGASSAEQDSKRSLLGASLVSGGKRRVRVRYYHLSTSESYASADTAFEHEGVVHGVDLGMSWLAPDSAGTGVGLGFKSRRLESSSLGERTSTDFYAEARKELRWERAMVQGSVRLEKNSGFDMEIAAGLAARFDPRKGISLFSRLDRSYRFPGFGVIYNRGAQMPADSRVESQTSLGVELGAIAERGPLTASLSAFRRDTDGLALRMTGESCEAYLDPAVEIAVTGVEVSLGVRLAPWLETRVQYSAIRARDASGQRPPYVPEQVVTFLARVSRRFSRHISAGMTFAGRYVPAIDVGPRLEPCGTACFADADLPAHLSAMLNVYVDIDRVTTFFKIRNLTNDDIRTAWGRPGLPRRSYEFGTSWRLLD